MVHYMEYLEDRTAHGKLSGLFDGISLGQEGGTMLVSSVRVVDCKLNM